MAKQRSSASQDLSRRVQRTFGERLQRARTSADPKISQSIVAQALEVTRTSISNIENGRHRVFLDQVYAAARALGIPISMLLPDESEILSLPSVHVSSSAEIDPRQLQELLPLAAAAVRRHSDSPPERRHRRSRSR